MADVNVKRVGVGSAERLAADFTESSGILPGFTWAERHKAEVCDVPLVLIGDILSPAGTSMRRRKHNEAQKKYTPEDSNL
jgi:hypothetical protein